MLLLSCCQQFTLPRGGTVFAKTESFIDPILNFESLQLFGGGEHGGQK